jgi:hypothetical protein
MTQTILKPERPPSNAADQTAVDNIRYTSAWNMTMSHLEGQEIRLPRSQVTTCP